MPKYQLADPDTKELANDLLFRFAKHGNYQEIIDNRVKLDILFAYGERDEDGNLLQCALKHHGIEVDGICSVVNLKNRAAGRGDVEILLDADKWDVMGDAAREALLDHELYHIDFKRDKDGSVQLDDLGRPCIKMRAHDFEVGWFAAIAARHGDASGERRQAKAVMDQFGQYFWGGLDALAKGAAQRFKDSLPKGTSVTIQAGEEPVTIEGEK